ncbi:IucA/IucC family protein [Pontibacillus yanchengensis]|uniref:Iron transporter n=1 Tax=Pontibacillus yanchengensis Y32 TaxID=1385514 RepID=A0A0A2TCE1_9BACI|nr:IucA/IucC family protein [Pontibacillus yanchengensis]KGP72093.1 iron transporter [Pontibacillus yanchengensis Y32]
MNAKQLAEHATFQSFLNCFLRETGRGDVKMASDSPSFCEEKDSEKWMHCYLDKQRIHLYVALDYWSETGRHLFGNVAVYFTIDHPEPIELDYVSLVHVTTKELSLLYPNASYRMDELLLRVIQSEQAMEQFIEARWEDQEQLQHQDFTFIEAEQSLIFGHLLHPTPKSRQGFSENEMKVYSPELKGSFPLHYFRAPKEYVYQGSALEQSTVAIMKQLVQNDPDISEDIKRKYAQDDDYALIALHPWQAHFIKGNSQIAALIKSGTIEDLGTMGRTFYPTTSIRTVYHPEVPYMFKFSLNIKVTNSVRANLWKELERGVEVKKIMDSEIGDELRERYPDFSIITDPAFITIQLEGMKETGFEVILRDNPFMKEEANHVTPVVALCQDTIGGKGSRLASIIQGIASREEASTEEVSERWFRRYLDRTLTPIMWLYIQKGIAPEAHQQNSVIRLKGGYPEAFYYRDNQGYYFVKSQQQNLERLIPSFNEKSDTVCADDVGDERLRYYFFINHLFGLINAFGTSRLIDEAKLLSIVREYLASIRVPENHPSQLIDSLLHKPSLPSKANLLTRFHDMDELVGAMETQSVYVAIRNPLYEKGGVLSESASTSF